MSIVEISAPMFSHSNPKCRACKYYGKGEVFEVTSNCECKDNKVKRRHRCHNDKACSFFRLAEWLK